MRKKDILIVYAVVIATIKVAHRRSKLRMRREMLFEGLNRNGMWIRVREITAPYVIAETMVLAIHTLRYRAGYGSQPGMEEASDIGEEVQKLGGWRTIRYSGQQLIHKYAAINIEG